MARPTRTATVVMQEAKDWGPAASGIFNNIRTPAALIAGATFGGIFALQPSLADTALQGAAKRIYLLIGIGTLASELVATIVATCALEKLSDEQALNRVGSYEGVKSFLRGVGLELDYVASETHFLFGVLGFAIMVGMRAWIAFACPAFGVAGLSTIIAALCLMLFFINGGSSNAARPFAFLQEARLYVELLLQQAFSKPMSPWLLGAIGASAFTLVRVALGLRAILMMGGCSWALRSVG